MRGKAHSIEVKSEALAALLAGQNLTEVAKRYKLPTSTVQDIKNSINSEEFAKVRNKKQEELAILIEGHLHASLKAAIALAGQALNADWRNKQEADKLGVLYGILTDKAVRILEAAEASSAAEEEWPEHV